MPTRGELDARFAATCATWRRWAADRSYAGPAAGARDPQRTDPEAARVRTVGGAQLGLSLKGYSDLSTERRKHLLSGGFRLSERLSVVRKRESARSQRQVLVRAGCDTRKVQAPPVIQLDETFVLDGWRPEDAAAHRAFAEDANAARFLGWTVEEARAQPDFHYIGVVQKFQDEWATGSRLSLAIRRRTTGEAVGSVELRPIGDTAEVSYLVAPELRGQALAPRALNALLEWARRELSLRHALLNCHARTSRRREWLRSAVSPSLPARVMSFATAAICSVGDFCGTR
jgi:RimJ/RimL family protein N-acetyltransferase